MINQTPLIDTRTAADIYKQARKLAQVYCPEWIVKAQNIRNGTDMSDVVLKLFSRLTETVLTQLNRVPEKHRLAFYDFLGIDQLGAQAALVPLTFTLTEGTSTANVLARTKVASAVDPTVIFETLNLLTLVTFSINKAFSINPWNDTFCNHEFDGTTGQTLFDGINSQHLKHQLCLSHSAFCPVVPGKIEIAITLTDAITNPERFFSRVSIDGNLFLDATVQKNTADPKEVILSINKTAPMISTLFGERAPWIFIEPGASVSIGTESTLPQIQSIQTTIRSGNIHPESLYINDIPAESKKGFFPFGQQPKVNDALYIGAKDVFSKTDAIITIMFKSHAGEKTDDLELCWEYLSGEGWEPIKLLSDTTGDFAATPKKPQEITFACPAIRPMVLGGVENLWVRLRIASGGYGIAGYYKEVSVDTIVAKDEAARQEMENLLAKKEQELTAALRAEVKAAMPSMEDSKLETIFGKKIRSSAEIDAAMEESLIKNSAILRKDLSEKGVAEGFYYIPPNYNPPHILSMALTFEYQQQQPDSCVTINGFSTIRHPEIKGLTPYEKPLGKPTFFIACTQELFNKPVSLYVSLKERAFDEERALCMPAGVSPEDLSGLPETARFTWSYYNGAEWKPLAVADGTRDFTRSGILEWLVPHDIKATTIQDTTAFWCKVEPRDDLPFEPPVIKGLYPNTVWAEQATIVKSEVLGASNGQANQRLSTTAKPLLEQQIIEILEPSLPSQEEREIIEAQEGAGAVRTVCTKSGDIIEVWITWHQVATMVNSGPQSRHYMVDRENGIIIFGDGERGMVPPALPNNIVIKKYTWGGGITGNQQSGTISKLKTAVPNVKCVTNYDGAMGGKAIETIDDVVQRAPHAIKNRNRAVTMEDFEWLARQSLPDVRTARCLRVGDTIRVIIVPRNNDDRPFPTMALIDYVKNYLAARAFAPLSSTIDVVGPVYSDIQIDLTVSPTEISLGALIVERIQECLRQFFGSGGGRDSNGIDFGDAVSLAEIAAIIEGIEGVDCVKEITIVKLAADGTTEQKASVSSGSTIITMAKDELPALALVNVTIKGSI